MNEKELIQKGFNAGYHLRQHKPELATQLQQGFTDKAHPYAQGFMAGTQQYAKDQSQAKSSFKESYFNKIKQQTKSRNKGKDTPDKGIDL